MRRRSGPAETRTCQRSAGREARRRSATKIDRGAPSRSAGSVSPPDKVRGRRAATNRS